MKSLSYVFQIFADDGNGYQTYGHQENIVKTEKQEEKIKDWANFTSRYYSTNQQIGR